MRAFSSKVAPVSSTRGGVPSAFGPTSSIGRSASRRLSSRCLAGLVVARRRRRRGPAPGRGWRCTRRLYSPPVESLLGRRPYLLAHRGASGYAPENTIAAFERALALRADGVETDLRASNDGVLVLMHDERVDRTTDGEGAVAVLTLDELRRLDAGGSYGPRFAGERVPTLDELLSRYGGRLPLCLEVKQPGIEARLVAAVRERGLLKPAA